MPTSAKPKVELRVPQARVLHIMMPERPDDPPSEWPMLTRANMRVACGLSPTNSMNRILHGIKAGAGKHDGLVEAGMLVEVAVDVDGLVEFNYRITELGVQYCLSHQVAEHDHN